MKNLALVALLSLAVSSPALAESKSYPINPATVKVATPALNVAARQRTWIAALAVSLVSVALASRTSNGAAVAQPTTQRVSLLPDQRQVAP